MSEYGANPPPPPPKKKRTGLVVLLVVGILVIGLVGSCAALMSAMSHATNDALKAGPAVVVVGTGAGSIDDVRPGKSGTAGTFASMTDDEYDGKIKCIIEVTDFTDS